MGIKSRDWKQIGDYITKIKSENLTYRTELPGITCLSLKTS